MGKLTWGKLGKSAADNFSEAIMYRARTAFPARGFMLLTYQIEELNGTQRLGKYDRNQLLGPLPNTTPGIVETEDDDDDDDDDDDGDDGDQNNNAAASDVYGAWPSLQKTAPSHAVRFPPSNLSDRRRMSLRAETRKGI